MKTDSWWINAGDYEGIDGDDVQLEQTEPDLSLLDAALVPLKIAKDNATERKSVLAAAMNLEEYDGVASQALARGDYQWLRPSSPTTCNPDLEDSLLDAYEHLQRISVGVQKALEHSADNPKLLQVLTATKNDLRAILAEIQRALFEKNVATETRNVTKAIVPQDAVMDEDASSRYVFNLTVFRNYLDALEEVIQALEGHRSRIS